MWALATCRASIFRGTVPDEYGDPVPNNTTPAASGVPLAVDERNSRVFDQATQTPRVVRVVTGTVPSTTDVLTGDRIRDDWNGVLYTVQNVTRPRTAGRAPDTVLELKRVGADDG
ncbi:head-tail adaptor protein [Amycolatopsis sp. NPDC051373]|uniref:head-tail adaptor protein n=1 Tax=Amycolatopsis sp. NPDC051373 TaxID=3155801 RepID=UPI00344D884B